MNALKTPFIIFSLAAVAYGAYVVINRKDKEQLGARPRAVEVNIPGPDAVAPQFSTGPAGGGLQARPGPPKRSPLSPAAGPGSSPAALAPPVAQLGSPRAPASVPRGIMRPAASSDSPGAAQHKFHTFMQGLERQLKAGRLAEAHLALSSWHQSTELSAQQSRQVTELLDQLAGTVVYSRRSLLQQPHTVRQGESLEQIAQTYNVPTQLLANINGIRDPQNLQPGRQLKVVSGPFDALISLGRQELTLMLKSRYAGRFPIGIGRDSQGLEGSYVVGDKTVDPTYRGPNRVTIAAGDPNNPLGKFWIGLRDGMDGQTAVRIGIHGTNDPRSVGRTEGRGSIRLADRDIRDVFGILSVGSKVTIRR